MAVFVLLTRFFGLERTKTAFFVLLPIVRSGFRSGTAGLLFRSYLIEESGNQCEYHVRQPESDSRRESVRVDEHLAEPQEEDVCEGQCDAYTDVPADSSSLLL